MLTFFRFFSFITIIVLLLTSTASFSQQVQVNEQELDYEIFDIVLKEKTLYQSAEFYRTNDGSILAPLQLIESLLEIDLTYNPDTRQFNGGFADIKIDTNLQQVSSSITGPTYWSNTEQGYYFDIKLISKLLQSELIINYNILSLIITPKDKTLTFPIEVRLLRESKELAYLPTDTVHYNFMVDDQYRLFTPPKGQVALGLANNSSDTTLNTNLSLYGDVLNHAANLTLNTNTVSKDVAGRLNFKRDQVSPNKKILGVLNNYSFGDVSNTLTRFGIPVSGLGFSFSTIDKRFNNYYGKAIIDENVPAGWEVELYRYGLLIAITTATEDGRVLFEDIDVNYGTNRFTLKLYGPYGETETRNSDVIVGNQIIKQGNVDFTVNYVDQTKSIFNNSSSDINSEFIPTFYMQSNIGLGNKTSLGLGYLSQEYAGIASDKDEQVILSLSKSLPSSLLDISTTFNDTDEYNYNINLVGAIGQQDRYRLTALSNKTDTVENNKITGYYFSRFDNFTITGVSSLTENIYTTEKNDIQNYQLIVGTPILGASISNKFDYTKTHTDIITVPDKEIIKGELSATKSFGSLVTSRFSLNYLLNQIDIQEPGITSAHLNTNWRTLTQMNGSLDISLYENDQYQIINRFAWKTKKINFTNNITYSSLTKWTVGIGITFNLDYDYYKNEVNLQSEYTAQSSTLDLFAYHDRNKSGNFDEFDSALSGVKFGSVTYWDDLPTNRRGYTYLPNARIGRPFKIDYDTRETKSDLLSPVYDDVYFYTHAGGVTSFDVPFNYTSYLDGLIVNLSDKTVPPSIPLELVTMNNKVLKTFKSDFNSSYSLEKMWPGKYKIRIEPGYLDKLGLVSLPAEHLINIKTGTNFVDVPDFELINVEEHVKNTSELAHNEFYTVQFGAYDSREYCALRVAQLKQSGFADAFYIIEGTNCKVFVGEFRTGAAADEYKSTMPKTLVDDGFTVIYREGEDIYSIQVEAYSIQLSAVIKDGKCDTAAFEEITRKLDHLYIVETDSYCKLYLGDYTSPLNARNALDKLPDSVKKGAFLVKH
ncbi:hypothetical protein GCM10008107_10260 [Psychrosphaera saromensis]|uniref:SPOR domain-containing protein n=1 Tax=Psychrosphaera saromensis TaxID=716813 RepID=A0A2S7UUM8_9GAMM|nr:SPOR domain-containing protein [Psychrosphaera saromensis]PQJ53694.1 hypothetical protein BTO11_08460 [Psychrosphaera saromensis]GHB63109.1 hypothetical protein GCM10008107_10260 [Psychrosphaera saromensis]GLQ15529.1 hypothetical protein GCM10007917_29840 [Psychrosphaera saromensis]